MLDQLLALEQRFDAAAQSLQPFDAGVWLGYAHHGFRAFGTPAELVTGLEASAVRRAIVSHTAGWLLDASIGNDLLAQALPSLPGCVGAMTVLPEGAECFDSLPVYIDAQLARGLRVARIFPKAHRYNLRIPTAGAMFTALQERGIPLIIQIGQTSMDELAGLAQKYPKLAIVIDSTGHHEFLNMRGVIGHLQQHPSLLVTPRGQFMCGGLELLAENIGAERIVFASNQPIDQMEASLSLVIHSFLSDEDKMKITHGNLERLLAGVGQGGIFA